MSLVRGAALALPAVLANPMRMAPSPRISIPIDATARFMFPLLVIVMIHPSVAMPALAGPGPTFSVCLLNRTRPRAVLPVCLTRRQ